MQRRRFLRLLPAAPLTTAAARLWAAPSIHEETPRFLLVFLRGGYDATNFLVPYASDFYYESRPGIAVPRPGSGNAAAVALDADWALHPALTDTLLPMYRQKQAAFVPFAGTRDMSRSHFETQDHIELGQGSRARDFRNGFLNRLATVVGSRAQPMAFTAQLPLSLQGPDRVPNMAMTVVGPRDVDVRSSDLIAQMYRGTDMGPAVREGFAVGREVAADMRDAAASGYAAEMVAASRGATNPRSFAAQASRIGTLMRMRFNIGFVDIGGWDTHVGEAGRNGSEGQLAQRLAELGSGLAALPHAMGPAWNQTVVVVLSEFGRTFRENGNRGTDHGHGTVHWVLGGAVRGERIAGEQLRIAPDTLNQNRDWPVLTDYRDLLGGIFRKQWGLGPSQLDTVFPGATPVDLRLV
ncbi:MAG: DUF1501 domain-containing protein [Betaproteobacteria bacterium]|nr:DUF1501 domain-containing protein [Betaproteobacteria bacterium]